MGFCSDHCTCCCSAKNQTANSENDSYYEASFQQSHKCRCLRKVLAITFSQLGLFIIITLYLIGGAYLFNYLEREPHQKRLNDSLKVLEASFNNLTDSMKRLRRSTSDNTQPKARYIGYHCVDYQIEALHREIERLQQIINHEHLISRKTEIQRLRLKINDLMSLGETKLLNKVLNHSFQIDLPAQIRSYESVLNPGRHIDEVDDLNYKNKLHHFVKRIYEAVQAGWVIPSLEKGAETVPVTQNKNTRLILPDNSSDSKVMELRNRTPRTDPWTKAGSLFYVITVITTIGYGEVVPVTKYGRLATIFYGLFGIPMMLLFLANLGSLMADVFRILYKRLCCCCIKKRKTSSSAPTGSRSMQRSLNSSSHGKQSVISQASLIRPTPGRSHKASVLHELVNRTATPLPGVTESIFVSLAGPHSIFVRAIQARKESRNVQVPLWVIFIIFALYLFLGGMFFAYFEKWTFLNSMYFVFITVSTIGFGDLLPGLNDEHHTHRLYKYVFSNIYLLLGLAMVAMCFDLMQQELKWRSKKLGRKIGLLSRQSFPNKNVH